MFFQNTELTKIKEENARLKEENARLKEEDARLKEENARLKSINVQLDEDLTENYRLKHMISILEDELSDKRLRHQNGTYFYIPRKNATYLFSTTPKIVNLIDDYIMYTKTGNDMIMNGIPEDFRYLYLLPKDTDLSILSTTIYQCDEFAIQKYKHLNTYLKKFEKHRFGIKD
jgi:hypothetical protein